MTKAQAHIEGGIKILYEQIVFAYIIFNFNLKFVIYIIIMISKLFENIFIFFCLSMSIGVCITYSY